MPHFLYLFILTSMRKHILYIKHKVRGKIEEKRRNALVFLRVFLITMHKMSYLDHDVRKVKVLDIFNLISKQSQFMLILITSIPLILPIPYPPGIPTVLSIPLTIFTINACLGRKLIKIPERILSYTVRMETITQIITKSKFVVRILARVTRGGRMALIADKKFTRLHASFMLIMAIFIITPFPGTNYLPAIAIFVMSLGMVLTDGVLLIFGYLIGFTGILIVTLFIIFGSKLVLTAMEFAKYILHHH